MNDLPPPFDLAWFRFMLGFIVGACVGSFTTMLVYRVPKGLSIVKPDSHCTTCKTPLGFWDLIPLLSWVVMRGRCRHCDAKIGARYLGIELAISTACGALAALIH